MGKTHSPPAWNVQWRSKACVLYRQLTPMDKASEKGIQCKKIRSRLIELGQCRWDLGYLDKCFIEAGGRENADSCYVVDFCRFNCRWLKERQTPESKLGVSTQTSISVRLEGRGFSGIAWHWNTLLFSVNQNPNLRKSPGLILWTIPWKRVPSRIRNRIKRDRVCFGRESRPEFEIGSLFKTACRLAIWKWHPLLYLI